MDLLTDPARISLVILALMLIAFSREIMAPSGIAVIGAACFLLFGYVDSDELLGVFANPAPIVIGALFVLSAALVRTGTLETLAATILELAKRQPASAVAVLLMVALLASAFINSTPIVVIMIPLVTSLAAAIGISSRRLLIPLSYVAILGGTCTLIGTSTNLLVDSIARQGGHPGFYIFDITVVGLCAAASGIVFLLAAGRWLLPGGDSREATQRVDARADIITECRLRTDNKDLGKPYAKLAWLEHRGVNLLTLSRSGKRLALNDPQTLAAANDRLVLRVTGAELATLHTMNGLDLGVRVRRVSEEPIEHGRVTLLSENRAIGHRITDAHFVSRFQISVTGVRRRRNLAGPDLSNLLLRAGDQLWISGPKSALQALAGDPYLAMSTLPAAKPFLRNRALFAILTLATVIATATLGLVSLHMAAIIGIGFMLLIRGMDTNDAWSALNADVLILIYAMLIVGVGLQNTGAVQFIIDLSVPLLHNLSPLGIVIVMYGLTSVLTETITNNAVAVIMTPIAMQLASALGMDATPLIIAVMFAASASFATPIGYQTNTLVHVAGNYRFVEFLKIGIPMNLIVGLSTCLAIVWWFG